MSNTPLFPKLQLIAQELRQISSRLTFTYSESAVMLRAAVTTDTSLRTSILMVAVPAGLLVSFSLYAENYFFAVMVLGSFLWHIRSISRSKQDLKALRLENYVLVDSSNKQIIVEHLNTYYQEQGMSDTTFGFDEVRAVGVQRRRANRENREYYGQLYLILADDTKFFLAELESERVAHNVAHILALLLGLPAQPWQKPSWWGV